MTYTVVLAKDHREAHRYAKGTLPRGRWRFATSANAIRGLRVSTIIELPGFAQRRDRHAINAELRFTRGERIVIEAERARTHTKGITKASRSGVAYFCEECSEAIQDWVEWPCSSRLPITYKVAQAVSTPEPEPIQESERLRRYRCKICGSLVWNDDDPSHDLMAHATNSPVTVKNFFG